MTNPAIGVFLPTMSERGRPTIDVSAAARHAEQLGFESVWAVDQLIAGTGVPLVDSTVALAIAAGATQRVRLAFGVMILPVHPVVWAAKQIASLQLASGGRVLLGVGVGGDRHHLSWDAAGVPSSARGRLTDDALAVLPGLIRGDEVDVDGVAVQLAPGVAMPPLLVGGVADAALRRVVRHDAAWFGLPLPPAALAPVLKRLDAIAAELGRPTTPFTASAMAAFTDDPTVPDAADLHRMLTDVDGVYGMPADAAPTMLVTGPPAAIADRIGELGRLGAQRVVFTLAAGDWFRQAELLRDAAALVTSRSE